MAYWLMKSEPSCFSWDDLVAKGKTHWDGVRNYQAAGNMKKMRLGDKAFFYHSNVEPGFVCKAIVGIMEVVREYYPDHTDPTGKFGMVDVTPLMPAPVPVTLAAVKADPRLEGIALIKQSRLSVMPVSAGHWQMLCGMAGIKAKAVA